MLVGSNVQARLPYSWPLKEERLDSAAAAERRYCTLYNSILSECSSNAALFGLRKRVQTKFSCSFWPVSILFRRALELLNTKSRAFDDTSTGKTKSHLDELNLSKDERS